MHPNPSLKNARPLERNSDTLLSNLSKRASDIGMETVDIAGFLDEVERQCQDQIAQIELVRDGADAVVGANGAVQHAITAVTDASAAALETVENSVGDLQQAAGRSTAVAEWVSDLEGRMTEVEDTLKSVQTNNTEIAEIARQVNILAINAKIEAARAGDLGRGFGVVAEAINELSRQTAAAADGISKSIKGLSGSISSLKDEAEGISLDARKVLENSSQADSALSDIASNVRTTAESAAHISTEAGKVGDAVQAFRPTFDTIAHSVKNTASGLEVAHGRIHSLVDMSETILQDSVELGGSSDDLWLINEVKAIAGKMSMAFEAGITNGRIRREDLFSQRYDPIPNTNPLQHMTSFTKFTDEVLPPIQEAALELDQAIVFCAAVDRSGYLPTHNLKFSQPQGDDPVWNVANCRNRRIFDDRVGLKAGRNTGPFLMQVYRRDMGGGTFAMMKDLSSPIMVDGQHWGGVRLAFKV